MLSHWLKSIALTLLFMDVNMPGLNGLEATRGIRKMLTKTEVAILSIHYTNQLVREVVDAGTYAYVLKSDATRDLISAVRAVTSHRPFFPSDAAQTILNALRARTNHSLIGRSLTARERKIVQLLPEGNSGKEVATTLGISVRTADTHRANIMRKLKMHSVSELGATRLKPTLLYHEMASRAKARHQALAYLLSKFLHDYRLARQLSRIARS